MADPINRDQTVFYECTRDPIFLYRVKRRTEMVTVRVFLTREEATVYGKRHEHDSPKWDVYCVPCEGALAKMLKERGDQYLVALNQPANAEVK